MRLALVGAVAAMTMVLFFGVAPQGAAAPVTNTPIQPGAPLGWGTIASCTQGFIFKDAAGIWYGSTAAHCVNLDDFVINTQAGDWFGQVVVDDDAPEQGGPADGIDFALFKVLTNKVNLINPAMRHWGGPTGIAAPADVLVDDRIVMIGYGGGVGDGYPVGAPQLNYAKARVGLAQEINNGWAYFNVPSIDGDSGSPILLHKDGKAFGGLSGIGETHAKFPSVNVNFGPSIHGAVARMATYGFTLTLQTAPFNPVPI